MKKTKNKKTQEKTKKKTTLDWTTSARLSTGTTFEFQTSDVTRDLTRSCCLPVYKEASVMRLVCDVTM